MERFIKGGHYVVVKPKDWDAFAEMCDNAGLTWGRRRQKVSECAPWPLREGKPVRVVVLGDMVLWAQANAPKSFNYPVMGFQNLKPLAKQANGAGIVSNGITVTARLFAGSETVNTAAATCSPDDTFRFGPGAVQALFRTFETEEDRILAMDLIKNERIKQLEPELPNIRDLVRGRKNTAGGVDADRLGEIVAEALSNVFGAQVVVVHEGEPRQCKSPIMRLIEDVMKGAPAGTVPYIDLCAKAEGAKP